MKILHMEVGGLATNCYIPYNEETLEGVVVDPGAEGDAIVEILQKYKLKIQAIFITHGHNDHIGGLAEVRAATGAKVYISKDDAHMLQNSHSALYDEPPKSFAPAEEYFTDGQELTVAGMHFKVVTTPGHTQGGVCIIMPEAKVVFCGDTVFAESIGRTDLPGGSYDDIIKSIKTKILTLDDDVQLLPGHGPDTTVGWERRRNPFLQ